MVKVLNILLLLAIPLGILFGFWKYSSSTQISTSTTENVQMIDGTQHITINAKYGYFPNNTIAKSGIPTKIILKTNNTYDCSVALLIRSINFQKVLAPNGEEVINLDIPQKGSLQGMCSMGMYFFNVNFI